MIPFDKLTAEGQIKFTKRYLESFETLSGGGFKPCMSYEHYWVDAFKNVASIKTSRVKYLSPVGKSKDKVPVSYPCEPYIDSYGRNRVTMGTSIAINSLFKDAWDD